MISAAILCISLGGLDYDMCPAVSFYDHAPLRSLVKRKVRPRLTARDEASMSIDVRPRPRYGMYNPPMIYYERPGVLRYRLQRR